MKFWKTDIDGGQNIWLDDFRYMDAAVREGLTKSIVGLNNGNPNCIVLGVNVTASGAHDTFSEGLVLINGELVISEAQVAGGVAFPELQVLTIIEAFYPEGNKTFEDGSIHDTYGIRKAIITGYNIGDPLPPGSVVMRVVPAFVIPRIKEAILGELLEYLKVWKTIAAGSISWITADVSDMGGYGIIYKKVGTTLNLNFFVNVLFGTNSSTLRFTIPGGIIPAAGILRFIGTGSDSAGNLLEAFMEPDGKIYFKRSDGDPFAAGPPINIRFQLSNIPVNA